MRKDNGVLPALILTLICLIATALLAITNQATLPARQQQALAAENENKFALFPDAAEFVELDISTHTTSFPSLTNAYQAVGQDGSELGILLAAASRGYGGEVPIMVAVDTADKISGIRVLSNDETPGLGKKIEDNEFLSQFSAKPIDIRYTTKIGEAGREVIDSVSGATISSRAVTESLNAALEVYTKISGGDS
ncbi:MAG: H+/Na+-translocating ferredoxin:NAD+ oxidoreductase subunit [Clostridiales bacterium]|jgi:electron transport complex protein RnfG|nr:H+/Na+-translocating ferredoxin:NAD+ oxidoreductase subunit [Clostridiales bacterium]